MSALGRELPRAMAVAGQKRTSIGAVRLNQADPPSGFGLHGLLGPGLSSSPDQLSEVEVLAAERLVVPLQARSSASVDELGDQVFQEDDTHPFPTALRQERVSRMRCLLCDLSVGAREKEHNLRLRGDVHQVSQDLIVLQEKRGIVAVLRQVRRVLEQRQIRIAKLLKVLRIGLRAGEAVFYVLDLDEEIPALLVLKVEVE